MSKYGDLLRFLYSGVEDELLRTQGQAHASIASETGEAPPGLPADGERHQDDEEALEIENQQAFLDFEVKLPFRSDGTHDFDAQDQAMTDVEQRAVEDQVTFFNHQLNNAERPLLRDNFRDEPDEFAGFQAVRSYVTHAAEHGQADKTWRRALLPSKLSDFCAWVRRFTSFNELWEQKRKQEEILAAGDCPRSEVAHQELLYKLLNDHRECRSQAHRDFLQLPVLDGDTFKMLLSTCTGPHNEQTDTNLHEASFTFESGSQVGTCSHTDICTQLGRYRRAKRRLCLSFDPSGLWLREDPTGSRREVLSTPKPVSLAAFFQQESLREDMPDTWLKKSRLAFRLATSLHCLYPGPWIQENWEAHVIQLLDIDSPCIPCEYHGDWKSTNPVWQEFSQLQAPLNWEWPLFFLCFAQLLVDIREGKPGGSYPTKPTRDWHQTLLCKAEETLRNEQLEWYGEAILGCLDYAMNFIIEKNKTGDDRDAAQAAIRSTIVENLAKNLEKWEGACGNYSRPEPKAVGELTGQTAATKPGNHGCSSSARTSSFTLFSDEEERYEEGLRDDNDTTDFLNRMKNFTPKFIKPLIDGKTLPPNYKRIRIAVLDTGLHIDEQDTQDTLLKFSSERVLTKHSKNYTGSSKEDRGNDIDDTHGHGTHVVRLLLKLAPRAEILVVKVSNGRTLETTKLGQLIDALEYAGQSADIINLSFGLDQGAKRLIQPVIDRIWEDGKLIFAAASNSGGNGKRAYPAKGSGVFAIHATKGNGYSPENMNPPADKILNNFATLGYRIPSRWDGKDVHISGTSFATPVAAAIAANALEFVQLAPPHYRSSNSRYFHVWGGMKHLFSCMSNKVDGYDYVRPWADNMFDTDASIDNMYERLKKMSIQHHRGTAESMSRRCSG
ncbi:hypothetical protein CEP54_012969 [Fusarium duplospermum]|uniref:Uncharacterized protein n=1 Tax=Fusarium duplospermum TaxID=1325734 RepID=A0A428P5P8_9HYPO|nr:hypothetical protein CEP54_012969 [Fusarium duplospermum]